MRAAVALDHVAALAVHLQSPTRGRRICRKMRAQRNRIRHRTATVWVGTKIGEGHVLDVAVARQGNQRVPRRGWSPLSSGAGAGIDPAIIAAHKIRHGRVV